MIGLVNCQGYWNGLGTSFQTTYVYVIWIEKAINDLHILMHHVSLKSPALACMKSKKKSAQVWKVIYWTL